MFARALASKLLAHAPARSIDSASDLLWSTVLPTAAMQLGRVVSDRTRAFTAAAVATSLGSF
jgi:hypothetical protein